jgi:predicted AlkP superfamily phosphohydrolase/phosphomutase
MMTSHGEGPVLLIGMDATQATLVDELVDEGRLPVLADLRARGTWGGLRTDPNAFLSMVWPTFFSGEDVGHHGWYFNKLWRPDRQRLEYVTPEWLPIRPFWEDVPREKRLALLDVPFAYPPADDSHGWFLTGWQNHDDFGQHTRPRSLWKDLKKAVGPPRLRPEFFGHQTVGSLLRQRRESIETTDQFAALCEYTMEREDWDLLVAVFGGAHRGSHYLWDLSQVDTSGTSEADLGLLRHACRDMYEACDRALGRIVARMPADARLLVFALHGMGPNAAWSEYFHRMVAQIQSGGGTPPPKGGLVYRVKKALPWSLVRQITTRVPSALNHAVVPIWSARMHDWAATKFFALPLDLNGYLRINLKGRDAEGIVEPGAEYEDLLDELEEAFRSFRDLKTGREIVGDVVRVDDLVGRDAPARWVLPDLVVLWNDVSAIGSTGFTSEKYGEVRWEAGEKLPSGRSGNHLQSGWFAAAGAGIPAAGRVDRTMRTVDILPTAFRWMGVDAPARFQGEPFPELGGAGAR